MRFMVSGKKISVKNEKSDIYTHLPMIKNITSGEWRRALWLIAGNCKSHEFS